MILELDGPHLIKQLKIVFYIKLTIKSAMQEMKLYAPNVEAILVICLKMVQKKPQVKGTVLIH